MDLFLAPPREKSSFSPWKRGDHTTIETLRATVVNVDFWTKLMNHLWEENGANSVSNDNIACIKSICK
jgi:hypothetical protein